jgi:hypothetical protein
MPQGQAFYLNLESAQRTGRLQKSGCAPLYKGLTTCKELSESFSLQQYHKKKGQKTIDM